MCTGALCMFTHVCAGSYMLVRVCACMCMLMCCLHAVGASHDDAPMAFNSAEWDSDFLDTFFALGLTPPSAASGTATAAPAPATAGVASLATVGNATTLQPRANSSAAPPATSNSAIASGVTHTENGESTSTVPMAFASSTFTATASLINCALNTTWWPRGWVCSNVRLQHASTHGTGETVNGDTALSQDERRAIVCVTL